jgi:copper resistance protein C
LIKRSACVLVFALLAMFGSVVSASAHGELEGADPEPNAQLKAPPPDVTMTFTEEPSSDSVIDVTDGCGNDVVQQSLVDGNDFVVRLATGQPGKWNASFRVISAEDGHLTKGQYSFTVAGKKDCSPDKGGDGNGNGDGNGDGPSPGTGGDGSNASDDLPDDGSDFPVVPVVIGAVVLVVVGVVIRRASAG